jgi:hypothetical protein
VAALVEAADDAGTFDLSLNDGEVTLDALEPGLPQTRPASPDHNEQWTLELTRGDVTKMDNLLLLLTYEGKLEW